MKIFLTILLLITGLQKSSFACCIEDNRTLTELLFQGKPGTIFTCKILTTTKDRNEDIISTAQIIAVYFGSVDSTIISLYTGNNNSSTGGSHLTVGKTYLIYSGGNKHNFGCCSICDRWTKQVSDIPDSTHEVKIIKQFTDIINNKKTGNFTFKNANGIVIAKGKFKKGLAIGIWQHFNDKGIIKVEFDLNNKTTSQFDENGNIKNRNTSLGDIKIYEGFSSKTKDLLEYKEIDTVKSPSLTINTFYEYYPNGNLKKLHGQYNRNGSSGFTNTWEEYFENGKLHIRGQYINNIRVGVWKWYKEDGSFDTEYDYKMEQIQTEDE
jgi:antitoxin component YwqK of YwqJK toxin-antitoxin module